MTEKSSVEIFDQNFAQIKENISAAAKSIGKAEKDIILLAATKTQDIETINHAIKSGIEYIGENRVQEFLQKKDLYENAHKHFIGHLQTNKVNKIVGEVELIHSVDSLHLAECISKEANKKGIVQDILLEINIGGEESKSGIEESELPELLSQVSKLNGVRVRGLMAIPPVTNTADGNRPYFEKMHKLFIDNSNNILDNVTMDYLSMGMSDDYACAVSCGANLVRIGTALFGKRNYNLK